MTEVFIGVLALALGFAWGLTTGAKEGEWRGWIKGRERQMDDVEIALKEGKQIDHAYVKNVRAEVRSFS